MREGSTAVNIEVRLASVHDGYRAWCPTLPGCRVRGKSRQQVLDAIHHAILGYLASLDQAIPSTLTEIVAGEPVSIDNPPLSSKTPQTAPARAFAGRCRDLRQAQDKRWRPVRDYAA